MARDASHEPAYKADSLIAEDIDAYLEQHQNKGLLRFSFSKDRSKIIQVETIEDSLKECRGLLYAHGALYANANNSKALYRLRDTNGDGKFEEEKLLKATGGGVGHGQGDGEDGVGSQAGLGGE